MNSELPLYGLDLLGDVVKPKTSGPVADRFTFPPFSVLDARQGDWQERKRAWLSLGIKSEVGRAGLGDTSCVIIPEWFQNGREKFGHDGGSIFDPVLCEIAYRWFCPIGGQVVDPFAGGSVRGVIAKSVSRKYWGCDLRIDQIKANIHQAEEIFDGYEGESGDFFGTQDLQWVCGDSMETLASAPDADFVFSCPPYGDLEVYSDDPRDLSKMEWHTFVAAYKRIILRSVYNDAVLVTSVGTAAMRVTKQFDSGRKLCKTHQNVLVFCKGDWRKAAEKCIT